MKQNVSVVWNVMHIAEDTETKKNYNGSSPTVYRNTLMVMGIPTHIRIWGLCSH